MRILLIGDSHSLGPAGNAFMQAMQDAGNEVIRDGRVGRSARDLVGKESGNVDAGIAQHPDITVYWLGTNDGPGDATNQAYQALHDTAAGVAWAVGPPSFAEDATASDGSSLVDRSDANAEAMAAVFGSRFVDSRPLTIDALRPPDRTKDLIHFNTTAGTAWGRAAAQQVLAGGGHGRVVALAGGGLLLALLAYGIYRWVRQ